MKLPGLVSFRPSLEKKQVAQNSKTHTGLNHGLNISFSMFILNLPF